MQVSGTKEVMDDSSSLPLRGLKVLKDLPTFNTSKHPSGMLQKNRKRNPMYQRGAENPVWEKKAYTKKKKFFFNFLWAPVLWEIVIRM